MKPFEFQILADRLLKGEPHPAGFRSAISRAYYAAHHCIREFVESAGVTLLEGQDSHADVWSHLANIGDPEIEQVGSDLADLRRERNVADYRLSKLHVENPQTASALVAQSRRLIETVQKCQADSTRFALIRSAIQKRHAVLRGINGQQTQE